jgi:hypothetical protein
MPGVVTNSTAEELLIATLQLELQSSNNSANIVVGISMIVASALCLLVNIIVIKVPHFIELYLYT